jgi:TRAP-type C4-dicarboxylate transport system substrate-binding protein
MKAISRPLGGRSHNVWTFALVTLALVMLAGAGAARAQKVNLKLATLVPEGTVWHGILSEMGSEWSKVSGGQVQLTIYPGGVAGDEPDAVRKMRIGQLQAATLTVAGLGQIDPAFRVFQVPLFFASYEELYAVLDQLRPTFEQRLKDKGFVLVHWGHAGWVHLFSKQPVQSIQDLKAQELFVWAGDDQMVQWWKKNGYKPVALAATDILTALETGMIKALPTTPLAALSLQWYRSVPNMMGTGIAPLVGATVVTTKAWEKIPEAERAKLAAAAKKAEQRLGKEVPAQDAQAVEEMKKRGLTVTTVRDEAEWKKAAEALGSTTRGDVVDTAIFDAAVAARDAYRAGKQ